MKMTPPDHRLLLPPPRPHLPHHLILTTHLIMVRCLCLKRRMNQRQYLMMKNLPGQPLLLNHTAKGRQKPHLAVLQQAIRVLSTMKSPSLRAGLIHLLRQNPMPLRRETSPVDHTHLLLFHLSRVESNHSYLGKQPYQTMIMTTLWNECLTMIQLSRN